MRLRMHAIVNMEFSELVGNSFGVTITCQHYNQSLYLDVVPYT